MAQFYGDLQGSRGTVTRCGGKPSGMTAHIRGWRTGARVVLSHEDGEDVVRVYRTKGSRGAQLGGDDTLLAEFGETEKADARLELQRLEDATE